jgi:galactokinase/mevalonate kinase-like predicted kinase
MEQAAATLSVDAWQRELSRLDLKATADVYVRERWSAPPALPREGPGGNLSMVHESMFRAAVARRREQGDKAAAHEQDAFAGLRRLMIDQVALSPVLPGRNVLEDQIVWGRSPVRIDLAGGWTDTPPYCIENGGCVVNLAADLNGQPPIQVFGRICREPKIVIRSIDLGIDERIATYEELRRYGQLGSGFGIARAALALSGMDPRFHAGNGHGSLRKQLSEEIGGGIELSMLAAIPRGSGLGTSSILAATLLGTLSELLGLHWDRADLLTKTMVLEQMLTAGGGWQDQVGGICGGLKLVETIPGLTQHAVIRELPGQFFEDSCAARRVLLYYTGITRVAHDILGEIVRGIFLNSAAHMSIIREIGHNAAFTADAIQRSDWPGLCEAVARSWSLNQRLDRGTNPAEVQAILDRIGDACQACKLLGAGGGGYLLILARDGEAGQQIKDRLRSDPPNARARFVGMTLARRGFQVTRS